MHLLFPKIPLLGIYPVEVIGQVLKNVGMTMFVSTMGKNPNGDEYFNILVHVTDKNIKVL